MLQRIANDTITAIDYCPLRKLLELQFAGEKTISQYFDVPEDIWYALKGAQNMDLFFNTQILGRYPMKKVSYANRDVIRKSINIL